MCVCFTFVSSVISLCNLIYYTVILKNTIGFSILLFTAFSVGDKSYRQVLTPVNNSQLLLKLEIMDKFRLVTTTHSNTKEFTTFSSLHRYRRNGSSHDLEKLSVNVTMLAACKHKHFHFWHGSSSGIFVITEWKNAVITLLVFFKLSIFCG